MLIPRTYPFQSAGTPRVIAALVVAAALAGCGSSGGSSTTPAPAAAAAPAAAGSTTAPGSFDQALVTPTKTKSSPAASDPTSTKGAITTTTASSASQALALSSGASSTTATSPTIAPSKATTTTAPPKIVTKVVVVPSKPKIKIVTLTRFATKVVTKTVTVAPKVPVGAFLPSTHPALSLTSFKVASGTVGCVIGGGSVRCDVARQTWTAPVQPESCTQSWGTGIVLINSAGAHLPQFACGGTSALRAGAKTIQKGYDDTVGDVTCQVRGFGVDCFAADQKGFILSPTGYILY